MLVPSWWPQPHLHRAERAPSGFSGVCWWGWACASASPSTGSLILLFPRSLEKFGIPEAADQVWHLPKSRWGRAEAASSTADVAGCTTVHPGMCLIELAVNEASFHIPCFYFAALFSRFGETLLHQTSCRDGESVFFFCHLSVTMNEGCVSFLLPLLMPLGSFLCCFIFLPFFGSGGCSTGQGIDPSAPASAPASPLRLHRPRGSDKPHPQG